MRKLLLVHDRTFVREQFAQMVSTIADISLAGQVGTVAAALDVLKTLTPDIIILDLQSPDGHGFEVLNVVKRLLPRTRVIALTNYPFPQNKRRAIAAGAEYFFDKSLEFEKVVDMLKESNQHSIQV